MKNGLRKLVQVRSGGIAEIALVSDRTGAHSWRYQVRTYAPGLKTPLPWGGELPYVYKNFWLHSRALRYYHARIDAWSFMPKTIYIEDDLKVLAKHAVTLTLAAALRWARLGA